MPAIGELWSPRTDGGVALQVVVTIALVATLVWFLRSERALVLLVIGTGCAVLGWYGIGSLH